MTVDQARNCDLAFSELPIESRGFEIFDIARTDISPRALLREKGSPAHRRWA